MREPLTQTQVVAYLHGLAEAGHRILLLTYEKTPLTTEQIHEAKLDLAAKGIHEWHTLKYHKRPTLFATLWDIVSGVFFAVRVVRQHGVKLIHARSHVAGVVGLCVKKLVGVKLLFDLRGLLAEEYADAGVWPQDGFLFRMTKRMERLLLRNSDEVVVLTESVRRKLMDQVPAGRELRVIPCCVDCPSFRSGTVVDQRADGPPYMLYVGKLGGWYPTRQMVEFFAAAREVIPDLRWKILTQHGDKELRPLLGSHGLASHVEIGSVAPQDLPAAMQGALFAICLYNRTLSAAACSPTKVGEYLAAGVPVIANAGIGDLEQLLQGGSSATGVGAIIREFSPAAYHLAVQKLLDLRAEADVVALCQELAREKLDLHSVGWPRYETIYRSLGA